MIFDPNPLFFTMCKIFAENYTSENKLIICNEGGTRCFHPDTQIETSEGVKQIQSMRVGDLVHSFNHKTGQRELKKVVEIIATGGNKKPCVKIKLKNGSEIICTDDHKFYFRWGYLEIKHILTFKSNLKDRNKHEINLDQIESFEYIDCKTVYDLCVEENSNYFINSGGESILVHNSSKTWDAFAFIVAFCDQNTKNEIYILRDTLTNCRDFTYKEFKLCLQKMEIWDQGNAKEFPKPEYTLNGNKIYFRGLDDEANVEGYPSDIIFINEALETDKSKIDGLKMRCRKLMILDWNPKYTQHWCFDLEGQPNVFFTHTTYKNNRHLQKSVVKEIEGYSPWMIEDMDLPESERRPNLVNLANRTVDKTRWMVYGMGLRCAPEGVIFENIQFIDEFPDIAHTYGMDFGFTADPLTVVRHSEDKGNIYGELLYYRPCDNAEDVAMILQSLGIRKSDIITADSADRYVSEKKGAVEMVSSLRSMGWNISKVKKTKNVMFWIGSMKSKKINIVKNQIPCGCGCNKMIWNHAKIESENYVLKEVNGIKVNQPIDGFDHFWSGLRYSHMAQNSRVFELGF